MPRATASHDRSRSGRIAGHRQFCADLVTAPFNVLAPALRDACLDERRDWFLGPCPWQIFPGGTYVRTPRDDPAFLYQDVLVGFTGNANSGQPTLHAACFAALTLRAGKTVVHVGAVRATTRRCRAWSARAGTCARTKLMTTLPIVRGVC
jgi:protein-L-isoaspartate(D-aspartate) O-methyltransferase